MVQADIAVIGIGVMGKSLALQLEEKGFHVAVFDEYSATAVPHFLEEDGKGKRFVGPSNLSALLAGLKRPRKLLMMIKAGAPVDAYIEKLLPHLEEGDILIDGGNSHYAETKRRCETTKQKGVLFVGCGISGGEKGARYGASLMPGGAPEAWPHIQELISALAATAYDGSTCCHWMGADGAGHFVKMVHNGIEYGCMQLLAEIYQITRHMLEWGPETIQTTFQSWKDGPLAGYLIDISADILDKIDRETGQPMVEVILDRAGQKGTGRWTCQIALDYGVTVPTIDAAVATRIISSARDLRQQLSQTLEESQLHAKGMIDLDSNRLQRTLHAAIFCTYAQGFVLLNEASKQEGWDLPFAEIARIWTGGCIIRARILEDIQKIYQAQPDLQHLLESQTFTDLWNNNSRSWRQVVTGALTEGHPIPALCSALTYVDSYRHATLPTQLIQAQRDYFGAHQYERTDKEGRFHTQWDQGKTLSSDPI